MCLNSIAQFAGSLTPLVVMSGVGNKMGKLMEHQLRPTATAGNNSAIAPYTNPAFVTTPFYVGMSLSSKATANTTINTTPHKDSPKGNAGGYCREVYNDHSRPLSTDLLPPLYHTCQVRSDG